MGKSIERLLGRQFCRVGCVSKGISVGLYKTMSINSAKSMNNSLSADLSWRYL